MSLRVSSTVLCGWRPRLTHYDVAVPKEHTIFRFTVPFPNPVGPTESGDQQQPAEAQGPKPLVFELHGSQFENRPVDRANKKFKWRNVDYL